MKMKKIAEVGVYRDSDRDCWSWIHEDYRKDANFCIRSIDPFERSDICIDQAKKVLGRLGFDDIRVTHIIIGKLVA